MAFQPGVEIVGNQMRNSLIGAMAVAEGELLATPDSAVSPQLIVVKNWCTLGRANEHIYPLRPPPVSGHTPMRPGPEVEMKSLSATAQDEVIGMANLIMLRQNEAPGGGGYAAVGAAIRSAMGALQMNDPTHSRGSLTSLVAQALGKGIDCLPDDADNRTRSIFGGFASSLRVPGRSTDRVNKVTGPVAFPFNEEERQALLVLRINYWAFTTGDMPIYVDGTQGKSAEQQYADLANSVLGQLIGT